MVQSWLGDRACSWAMIVNGINQYVTEMTEETHQYWRLLLQRLRCHIICVFGLNWNQIRTTRVVSKCQKMIRLLRHDPTVLREEDGAVEFRILAPMFRSEFTPSPYLSIRTWLNYLQKGGGAKKRYQYCVDPYSADTILHLRAIQGHSGGKHIDPTLQDNVLSPSDFVEHIYHVGSSHDYALDHLIWIDSGWQRRQEREACGVLYGREPNVHRALSRKGLRRDEAQDCSVQTRLEGAPKHSILV